MRKIITIVFLLLCALASIAQAQTITAQRYRFVVGCVSSAGAGSPEGVVTGSPCDEYRRTDGAAGTTLTGTPQ